METADRKLSARRINERVRLFASTLNTVGLSIFGAAFLLPAITGTAPRIAVPWILLAVVLHVLAHWMYRFLQSEG